MILLAPFRQLVKGDASAEDSILMTTPSHPSAAIIPSISRRQYVPALIATSALLSEVLTITLSTVPFSNANFWSAYVASTWISVAIIVFMLLTLMLLFAYREPKLPLKPVTVASSLAYLCDSALPDLFSELAIMDTAARDERIKGMGYQYWLGRSQNSGFTGITINVKASG